MANGLLKRRKRGVRRIGTSIDVNVGICLQMGVYQFQIPGRNQTIGVEDDEPVSFGALESKISRKSLSRVLLLKIMDIQPFLETEHGVLRVPLTSVFDYDDLKVLKRLMRQTLEELLDFFGSIVERYDDRKTHGPKYEAKQPNFIYPILQDPPCILGP